MRKKIKILHLEDFAEDAELVEFELYRANLDFEKRVVDNKADYEKMLCDFIPDIILADHSLPFFNSFEALAILKEKRLKTPFILVTATVSEQFAVDILKQGASDYILKDRLQRLPSAVINSIEKCRLEEDERASIERLLLHIENTPLGFIEWDDQGFAKSWSKRAEEIFGWTEKEFIERQQKWVTQPGKEDLSWLDEILQPLISGGLERNNVQHRSVAKDGRLIWCEWFNSALKDKEGNVKTIMSLVQDITEQKQLEWQKDNFLAIVSHELNTPLTTIKAYGQIAESILEEKNDLETLEMIKRVNSQVVKLAALVQDILDFTRTLEGKIIYNESFYDFNEQTKEVIEDMQKINFTHEIKSYPDKTETIFGDKNRLNQVLTNLISNAIKYSPKATNIVVSTELQKEGIKLSVQDFGIGLSQEDKENVFTPFYRVNKNKSTFPGMGIGLYISSEIIARHGGKMWVDSLIDKGSIFHAWLPFDHRNT